MISLNSIYRIWQMKYEVLVVLTLCKRASSERKLEILDKALKKKEGSSEKEKLSQEWETNYY